MDEVKGPDGIDRLIHEPGRLMILGVLNGVDEADFLFLRNQTELTKGNLSSHLAKLESAGYIDVEKTFVDKIPRTLYRLTPQGEAALRRYREHMSGVLKNLER